MTKLCFVLRGTNSAPLPLGELRSLFRVIGLCTSLGSVLMLALLVRLRCVPHLSVLRWARGVVLGHHSLLTEVSTGVLWV